VVGEQQAKAEIFLAFQEAEMKLAVEYRGVEFSVSGEYVPYSPARAYNRNGDPGEDAEGGYFEKFDILIGENSIFDLLKEEHVEAIEELAAREIKDLKSAFSGGRYDD
jgi:hypothetical protein